MYAVLSRLPKYLRKLGAAMASLWSSMKEVWLLRPSAIYVYARPDVAQKGYMDALLILETSGGHRSRPPAHSGIGIIAEMIVALEQNPYTPVLTRRTSEAFWSAKPSISLQNWNRGFDVLCSATTTVQRLERKLTERGPQTRLSMQAWQAVDI